MKFLQNFWIKNEAERSLFQHHNTPSSLSQEFIDIVFKTLKNYSQNPHKLTSFEIQNLSFFFYTQQNIDFFGVTDKKENCCNALEELKGIAAGFLQQFSSEPLTALKGDKEIFFSFYQHIPLPIDEPIVLIRNHD